MILKGSNIIVVLRELFRDFNLCSAMKKYYPYVPYILYQADGIMIVDVLAIGDNIRNTSQDTLYSSFATLKRTEDRLPVNMQHIPEDIKREVGQHFVFGFDGYEPTEGIIKLIKDYYVGAIILFKRNIKSIPQVHGLIQTLQKIAHEAGHGQPLLIGIDQENGLVSAFSSTPTTSAGTQFPGAMALGSSGSPSLAAETTAASARELKMVGINWVFSPVVDINSDPRNPVIGVRSFGEDPDVVATFVTTVAPAFASEGIAPCAKHFPGHGDTHVDSHLSLPVINKTLDELRQTELVPFAALATSPSPIASIMTAHIALPLLHSSLNTAPTATSTSASVPPASLSRLISTTLLRSAPPTGLGFQGVCVTDCLEMNAISEGVGVGPGAVEAIKAGADIVMICHRLDRKMAALDCVSDALRHGLGLPGGKNMTATEAISLEELKASGERIRALKARFTGSWEYVLNRPLDMAKFEALQAQNTILSQRVYRQTTRWLNLPDTITRPFISREESVLVLTPEMERINPAVDEPEPTTVGEELEGVMKTNDGKVRNTAGPSYVCFARATSVRNSQSSHLVYLISDSSSATLRSSLIQSVTSAQCIIFTTRNAHQTSSAWQLTVLKRVLTQIRESGKNVKVIVVASCAPYDNACLQKDEETKGLPVLCTYEFTKEALESAVCVLYNEN